MNIEPAANTSLLQKLSDSAQQDDAAALKTSVSVSPRMLPPHEEQEVQLSPPNEKAQSHTDAPAASGNQVITPEKIVSDDQPDDVAHEDTKGPFFTKTIKDLRLFFFIVLLRTMARYISNSPMVFYAFSLGASASTMGTLASLSSLLGALGSWGFGLITDIPGYGRRLGLGLGQVLVIGAFVFVLFAKTLPWLVIGMMIQAFSSGSEATQIAFIADRTTEAERPKVIALNGASFASGLVLGNIVAAVISNVLSGYTLYFVLTIAFSAICLALIVYYIKEPEANRRRSTFVGVRTEVVKLQEISIHHWILFAAMFCANYGFYGVLPNYPKYVESAFGWGLSIVTIITLAIGVVAILSQLVIPILTKRLSLQKISLVTSIISGSACCAIPLMTVSVLQVLVLMVFCCSYAIINTTIPIQVSQETAQARQGQMQGFLSIFSTIAGVVSPIVVGFLVEKVTAGGFGVIAFVQSGAVVLIGTSLIAFDLTRSRINPTPAVKMEESHAD